MNNVSFGRVIGGSMFCSGTVVCVVSAQKETTPWHVLNAGVLCPLAAQSQYGRFAIHPVQSALA